ncbi:hypothetical protein [Acidithiobacillus ferrooxidans]|jgi:hypothetical protein|uniref:hypothetical protein n=1 Tax=Acidithiobacillus ferrooxidans TaxID=920 RepID=UPI0031B7F680
MKKIGKKQGNNDRNRLKMSHFKKIGTKIGRSPKLKPTGSQHDGMPIDGLPIRRESVQIQRQNTGRQIRERFSRQNQKTGVIGDEMQALAQDPGSVGTSTRQKLPHLS